MQPRAWLDARGGRWTLPLARWTVERLVLHLAAGGQSPTPVLEAALAGDPCLALWAVLSAGDAMAELPTAATLAQWLAAEPLEWAAAPGSAPARTSAWAAVVVCPFEPPPGESGPDQERLSRLIGARRALAARAEALAAAGRRGNQVGRQARLLALVVDPDEMLEACGPHGAQGCEALLPCWLREANRAVAGQRVKGEHPAVAAVIRARQEPAELPLDDPPLTLPADEALAALAGILAQRRRLAELEGAFAQALESAKLAAMAELAAGAGHEINNPLAIISGRLQLMARQEPDPERRRELAALNSQTVRIYEMIADLMLFARPPRPQWGPADLGAVVDEVLASAAPRAAQRGVRLVRRGSAAVRLEADAAQLSVALKALVDNALDAARAGGEVCIEWDAPRDGRLSLVVCDDGPGISPAVREHLFDPFYSGRQAGRGLGMGLAKCWRIVTGHGGTIRVAGAAPRGTRFTIELPLAGPGNAAAEPLRAP